MCAATHHSRPRAARFTRRLGAIAASLLLAAVVSPAAAGDVERLKRDLQEGLSAGLLTRPLAEPPLVFRGPQSLGASIYRERAGSVVVVAVKDTIGAGSFVSGRGDIVTSGHVLRSAHRANGDEWVLVWFKPDPNFPATQEQFLVARVLARDVQRDLALIRLAEPPPHAATVVPIATAPPEIGDDVFAIGHPKNHFWSLTQGIVSQIRQEYAWVGADGVSRRATAIQTQAPASPGSSGGPLLDRRGAMVGVIFGGASTAPGIYLAIDARHVRELLAKEPLGSRHGP